MNEPKPTVPSQLSATARTADVGKATAQILRTWWRRFGIFTILVVMMIVLTFLSPRFLTALNLLNVTRQISMLGIITLGLMPVMVAGYVDLTVGVMMGFTGAVYAAVSLVSGPWVGALAAVALGATAGLVNGWLVTRGKGLTVIVTLSTMSIIYGGTLLLTKGAPISRFPKTLSFLGTGYMGPIPVPVVVLLFAAVIAYIVLTRLSFGRNLYALGGNPEAARLTGINVMRHVMITFVVSGICATVAGLILTNRVASAQPNAGSGEEMNAVAAALLGGTSLSGGTGRVTDVMAGVLILGLISNALNLLNIDPFFQYVAKGVIILAAIMLNHWGHKS